MGPAFEHGDDERLGVRPDLGGPAAEPLGRPFGVTAMRARHVLRVRPAPGAPVAALMDGDALAAMEDLDRAGGGAHVDLGADQRMRNRIEEVVDLDMIVEAQPRSPPFGELPIVDRQRDERVALNSVEQLATAHAKLAHRPFVHARDGARDRLIAFGEREERRVAEAPQDVHLGKADAGLDLGLVAGFSRPRRQNAGRIMRRHRGVGPVDLGIVERRLVDAALEIVGNQELRSPAEEPEHAHVRAGPIGQLLRPGRPRAAARG